MFACVREHGGGPQCCNVHIRWWLHWHWAYTFTSVHSARLDGTWLSSFILCILPPWVRHENRKMVKEVHTSYCLIESSEETLWWKLVRESICVPYLSRKCCYETTAYYCISAPTWQFTMQQTFYSSSSHVPNFACWQEYARTFFFFVVPLRFQQIMIMFQLKVISYTKEREGAEKWHTLLHNRGHYPTNVRPIIGIISLPYRTTMRDTSSGAEMMQSNLTVRFVSFGALGCWHLSCGLEASLPAQESWAGRDDALSMC